MAMRQGGKNRTIRTTPNQNQDQFRTPDRPSSKLRRAPARLHLAAETPPSSTLTSKSASASRSKSGKRNSTSRYAPVPDQPTLTQIDFVTVSQRPGSDDDDDDDDDDGLDYIVCPRENGPEVIEIADDDPEYEPSSASRARRSREGTLAHGTDNNIFSRRTETPVRSVGEPRRRRRKSGRKSDGGAQLKNSTLTQLNFVRRYWKVDSDDDVELEYTYATPQNKDPERQTTTSHGHEGVQKKETLTDFSSQNKRRKLSPTSDIKEAQAEESEENKVSVTPKKPPRSEIPSSQSPESPGVAFISSSQFRRATLSPSKRALQMASVKEESPALHNTPDGILEGPRRTAYLDDNPLGPSNVNSPSRSPRLGFKEIGISKTTKSPNKTAEDPTETWNRKEHPATTQRTVVYETDAETDYGDFQDDMQEVPSSPHGEETARSNTRTIDEGMPESPTMESQELPSIPFPSQVSDTGPLPSETNLLSDASICYQRLQPATQFPLEPVPTINTQKMAELFPEESNSLQTPRTASQLSPSEKGGLLLGPQLETQSQTQSQPEYHQVERTAPEIIPESSPIAQQEANASLNDHGPAAREVVVQVESSQPIDRIHRQMAMEQDSGPRGILSRSQILTSSVMESIPIPAFWMSSQDSLGEPYSLPDT